MKTKILTLIIALTITCIYSQTDKNQNEYLQNGWYEISKSESGVIRKDKRTNEKYYLVSEPIVTSKNIESYEEFSNFEGHEGIALYFDNKGTERWRIATKNSTGSYLIFILENEIISVQKVNSEITGGVSAFWKNLQTENEWKKLKEILN